MPLFRRRLDKEQKRVLDKKMLLAKEKPDSVFDLSGIGIYEIPEGVFALCKVLQKEALLLQNNKLENFKGGGLMQDLCHIKVLDLSHNNFSKLSTDVGCLSDVQRLDMSYNHLKSLPSSIGNLTNLETLNLRGNDLTELPPSIKSLTKLQSLDIRQNRLLTHLPVNLCYLFDLKELYFDIETLKYPPKEVAAKGVDEIRRWFSLVVGDNFAEIAAGCSTFPGPSTDLHAICLTQDDNSKFEEKILQLEREKEMKRRKRLELEQQILDSQSENAMLLSYAQQQRQMMLSKVAHEEMKSQAEIMKRYEDIESGRQKLINELRTEDTLMNDTVCLVLQMSERARNTETLLEELEQDRQKLDELVTITTEESERLRKEEVIRAMSFVLQDLEKHMQVFKAYEESQDKIKNKALESYEVSDHAIESVLFERETQRKDLLQRIHTEEEAQKQAFQILQCQKDAKLGRIKKQIGMIEDELVRLAILEAQKRHEREEQDLQTLSEMRVNTALLLSTLVEEQERREQQLINRLHEMENLREEETKDFWLIQYQRLLDSKPQILIDEENQLEVFVVDSLLNAGARDFMPMFARRRISKEALIEMKDKDLKELGVHDEYKRQQILAAVKAQLLLDEKTNMPLAPAASTTDTVENPAATAPAAISGREAILEADCVICLDKQPEVIFLPCGHICACMVCSQAVQQCPLCRQDIEQRCRMYRP